MPELLLYGIIGDAADKLDAATVTSTIRAATGPLAVRVNSPGGSVMDGLAIIEALRSYPGKVTINVDGMAASMASAIAMVGTETIMAESALMMVHKPWLASFGNADELRKDAAALDRMEEQLIGIYAKKSGLSASVLSQMLADETWMTADEALSLGFVNSISVPIKAAAMAKATGYGFRKIPDRLNQEEGLMPYQNDSAQAIATERTRISTIMALGEKHRLPGQMTRDLIDKGTELGEARATMLDFLAAESDRQHIGGRYGDHISLDNPATRSKAMADAIVAKMLNKPAEGPAAEYRAMTLVDIARECLANHGVRDAYRMAPDRVASMAMRRDPGTYAGFRLRYFSSLS